MRFRSVLAALVLVSCVQSDGTSGAGLGAGATSDPNTIVRRSDPTVFWSAHTRANACYTPEFEVGRAAAIRDGRPRSAPPQITQATADAVAPITPLAPSAACSLPAPGAVPAPVVDAGVTSDYLGDDWSALEPTRRFLARGISYHRAAPSTARAEPLVSFLGSWSTANALSENIRFAAFDNPNTFRLDFSVQAVIPLLITAYADTAQYMTPEERLRTGQWIGRLVGQSEQSDMGERQDNKTYVRAQIALMWGIVTSDERLIARARSDYQNALYDMRPDGTFPIDAARGGSGLHYNNRSTMMLVSLAATARAIGEDWFATSVNGRTVYDAVLWSARSNADPLMNSRYALSCEAGTGTITAPDMFHLRILADRQTHSAWVPLYQRYGQEPETVAAISRSVPWAGPTSNVWEETIGGPAACMFAGVP